MQLSLDQLGSMLGEGTFGWVFALKDSSDIAVKLTKHSPLQLLKEAKVLKMMAHTGLFPNVLFPQFSSSPLEQSSCPHHSQRKKRSK
jgi:predicted Ser/Thr protein kinase